MIAKAALLAGILITLTGCGGGTQDAAPPTVPVSSESGPGEAVDDPIGLPAAPTTEEASQTLAGEAVEITDGDTFTLLVGEERIRVHLDGIDCPELKGDQPYCRQSTQALTELIAGKAVSVKSPGTDYYGRTLGRVFVDGLDVNREMVARGLAWHYVEYSDDESLATAERAARAAKAGLWADPEPIPPWDWRRRN